MNGIYFFITGYMNLRERLLELFDTENVKQSQIAEKMGVKRQTLNDSLSRDMRISKFERIVDALGYRVEFVKK